MFFLLNPFQPSSYTPANCVFFVWLWGGILFSHLSICPTTTVWFLLNILKRVMMELCPLSWKGWGCGCGGGWGGHIAFLWGSRWRWHCSFSALCLRNQRVYFDQTCTDTLLGGRKEVIRFWWPWPLFQGDTSTEIFKFLPKKACVHPISWTKWRILAKLYIL